MACNRTVVIADSALKPELISERRLVSEAWDDRYIAFKGIHRDIWLAEVELP